MNEKKLGLLSLMMMGIGNIIGAGLFNMLPIVVGITGRSSSLAIILGSILALFSVVPAVFLASIMKLDGGVYTKYLAVLPKPAVCMLSIMEMVGYLGFASFALGLANYTVQLLPSGDPHKVLAIFYMLLFFLLGVKGVTVSATLQNIMMAVLLIALGTYVVGGLPKVQPGFFNAEGFFLGGVDGFVSATGLVSMTALGASSLVNLASVSKKPQRNIPLAMIFSTALVTILYCLIAVVTSGTVPIEMVANKTLGVVAETFMSKPVYLFFMVGGALFALGTTFNSVLAVIPYSWVKLAEDGWLPKILTKTDKKFNYHYVLMSIILVVCGILPVVFDLNVGTIGTLFGFPTFVAQAIFAVAALRIPKLYPERWNASPFRVPLGIYYLLTILSACACAFLAYSYMDYLDSTMIVTIVVLMSALAVYTVWRYKSGHVKIDMTELTKGME